MTDNVTVTLSSTTPTASIYYSTDNSTPTSSSLFYGGPFTLTSSATVKAIAIADGYNDSAVSSETYTVTTGGGGGGGGCSVASTANRYDLSLLLALAACGLLCSLVRVRTVR